MKILNNTKRLPEENRRYYLHKRVKTFIARIDPRKKQLYYSDHDFTPYQQNIVNELLIKYGYALQRELPFK